MFLQKQFYKNPIFAFFPISDDFDMNEIILMEKNGEYDELWEMYFSYYQEKYTYVYKEIVEEDSSSSESDYEILDKDYLYYLSD